MRNCLLLAPVLAMFLFGWFLMKRVDVFLEENRRAQEKQSEKDGKVLRIGFSNPLVADSISDILERYSGQYPGYSVRLYHGDAEDLLKRAALHKLDVIFLPEQVDIPSDKDYNRRKVRLASVPVVMKYGGLPIDPIVDGSIFQNIVWMGYPKAPAVEYFLKSCNFDDRRESDGITETESG